MLDDAYGHGELDLFTAAPPASLTVIHHNGSKWNGQTPDPIEALFARLESHTLDPTFEGYGNFIDHSPTWWRGQHPYPDRSGMVVVFGNFFDYSHVFRIDTDDPDLIARLTAAIRANQERPAYADARVGVEEARRYWQGQ